MYTHGPWKCDPEAEKRGISLNGKPVFGLWEHKLQLIQELIKRGGSMTDREAACLFYGEYNEQTHLKLTRLLLRTRNALAEAPQGSPEAYLGRAGLRCIENKPEAAGQGDGGIITLYTSPQPDLYICDRRNDAWDLNSYRHSKIPTRKMRDKPVDPRICKTMGPWQFNPQNRYIYYKGKLLKGLSDEHHDMLASLLEAYPNRISGAQLATERYGNADSKSLKSFWMSMMHLHENLARYPEDLSRFVYTDMHHGYVLRASLTAEWETVVKPRLKTKGNWAFDPEAQQAYHGKKRLTLSDARLNMMRLLIMSNEPVSRKDMIEASGLSPDDPQLPRKIILLMSTFNEVLADTTKCEKNPIILLKGFEEEQRPYILDVAEKDMQGALKEEAGVKHIGRLSMHFKHRRAFIIGDGSKPEFLPLKIGAPNTWTALQALICEGPMDLETLNKKVFGIDGGDIGGVLKRLRDCFDKVAPDLGKKFIHYDQETKIYSVPTLWLLPQLIADR